MPVNSCTALGRHGRISHQPEDVQYGGFGPNRPCCHSLSHESSKTEELRGSELPHIRPLCGHPSPLRSKMGPLFRSTWVPFGSGARSVRKWETCRCLFVWVNKTSTWIEKRACRGKTCVQEFASRTEKGANRKKKSYMFQKESLMCTQCFPPIAAFVM